MGMQDETFKADLLRQLRSELKRSGLTDARIETLWSASGNAGQFTLVVKGMANWRDDPETEGEPFAALCEAVDASAYPLDAWLEAFEVLQQWLVSRGVDVPFGRLFGYVECTAQAAPIGVTPEPLAEAVLGMLEAYGFDPD